MHAKRQVFLNQPWRQIRTLLILLFGKTKALFEKDATRKKNCVFAYVICGKPKRNQQTKMGDCVFLRNQRPRAKIELIWTSKKKNGLKSHLG